MNHENADKKVLEASFLFFSDIEGRVSCLVVNEWHTDNVDRTDLDGSFLCFLVSPGSCATLMVNQWHTDDADRTDLDGSFLCFLVFSSVKFYCMITTSISGIILSFQTNLKEFVLC